MHARVRIPLLCFVAALLASAAPPQVSAALVEVTYFVSGTGFVDSHGNGPTGSTSTSIAGSFRFAFDPAETALQVVAPLSVADFDIRREDGLLIDFNEANTGVQVKFLHGLKQREITFGGSVHGAESMVGLTQPGDFRVVFKISTDDFKVVQPVSKPFGFMFQAVEPFYDSTLWAATLVSVVPEPKLYALLIAGLGLLCLRARWGNNRRPS